MEQLFGLVPCPSIVLQASLAQSSAALNQACEWHNDEEFAEAQGQIRSQNESGLTNHHVVQPATYEHD